jgi:hypothetical protein
MTDVCNVAQSLIHFVLSGETTQTDACLRRRSSETDVLPAAGSAILKARPAGRDLPINTRIDGSIVTFFIKPRLLMLRCSEPK